MRTYTISVTVAAAGEVWWRLSVPGLRMEDGAYHATGSAETTQRAFAEACRAFRDYQRAEGVEG